MRHDHERYIHLLNESADQWRKRHRGFSKQIKAMSKENLIELVLQLARKGEHDTAKINMLVEKLQRSESLSDDQRNNVKFLYKRVEHDQPLVETQLYFQKRRKDKRGSKMPLLDQFIDNADLSKTNDAIWCDLPLKGKLRRNEDGEKWYIIEGKKRIQQSTFFNRLSKARNSQKA